MAAATTAQSPRARRCQELLHACYNRRAGEAVHKAPVRHRPANGLLPTAPDGLARPVRSSAEGSGTSQPTMHVPHRSPGSALIKLAQSYASPPPRTKASLCQGAPPVFFAACEVPFGRCGFRSDP
jgi:hypothetical protein